MTCEHPKTPCDGVCTCCCDRCINPLRKDTTLKPLQSFLLEKIEETGIDTPAETLLSLAITAGYTNAGKQHVYAAKNAAKKGTKPRGTDRAEEPQKRTPRKPREEKTAAQSVPLNSAPSLEEIRSAMRVLGVERVTITLDGVYIQGD